MEKEIPKQKEKQMLQGNTIQCSYYFLDLQTIFSFQVIPNLFYQYWSSMCFTYADLYKT